jgi:hypothetical protein
LITLWILFVFTIVGNSVVLFSTWRRKRKSRMTFFVTQLAITGKCASRRGGSGMQNPCVSCFQLFYQWKCNPSKPKASANLGVISIGLENPFLNISSSKFNTFSLRDSIIKINPYTTVLEIPLSVSPNGSIGFHTSYT